MIDRFLVGIGATTGDLPRRVRIVPLPSIGHPNVSPSIRRVAVEVPADCPLPVRDVQWAFGDLDVADPRTGEVLATLVPASDRAMDRHYGVEMAVRRWRSVTPVALPQPPSRARTGAERAASERAAAAALAAAVRHAGVEARPVEMRLQREPFDSRGARADAFDAGRFQGRLRHVEVAFERPVNGPLMIGDGRFVGLGLMRPVREPPPAVHLFAIERGEKPAAGQSDLLVRALRRAVMARAQAVVGDASLPAFFTGHAPDGGPLRTGRHDHLFFLAEDANGEGRIDRLAVIAPHLADRTVNPERKRLDELDLALSGLSIVRAGAAGAPRLCALPPPGDDDPVFGRARTWVSRAPYRPTRHPRHPADSESAIRDDLATECARRGLPTPAVEILDWREGPRGGLAARARLVFASIVRGPILLGTGSHLGAGLFGIDTAR